MRIWPLLILLLLSSTIAAALPALPTEFYGNITTRGSLANIGGRISATWSGGGCANFTIQTRGGFGLLTCPSDDSETAAVEGPPNGTQIQFYYNGELAVTIGGDNTSGSSGFKYVRLSHPIPACGDGFCDTFFESNFTCPQDCNIPGNATNVTSNTTNSTTDQNQSGSGGGGSGSGGGGGGAGGGGGGGGGGGAGGGGGGGASSGGGSSSGAGGGLTTTVPGIISALTGLTGLTGPFGCEEEWVCTEWTNCTIEGLQQRTCTDRNACGSTKEKPPEFQACEYQPTCYDLVQNGDETGLDCGGLRCVACPGCTNGLRDPDEDGVDCGGNCRPCDSCFDGVRNHGERGVDCGGPCTECIEQVPPVLEFPTFVCEKSPNPLANDAKWFLLLVAVLSGVRIWLYTREMKRIRKDELLDSFKRARRYVETRRELFLFALVVVAICLLSYFYYYEFLLCKVGYEYLWLYLLLLILMPLLVAGLIKWLAYTDGRKLAALQRGAKTHEQLLADVLTFENEQLVAIEQEIALRLEQVAADQKIVAELGRLPQLHEIYENIVRLHDEYHKNKTPTGIEKALCDEVYAVETNDAFKRLAARYPDVALIYRKLALLYHHYEQKQQLYDELAQLREQNKQKLEAGPAPEVSEEKEGGEEKEEPKK